MWSLIKHNIFGLKYISEVFFNPQNFTQIEFTLNICTL